MRIKLREWRRVVAGSVAASVVAAAAFVSTAPTQGPAPRASELRIVISVAERRLWVVDPAGDTLRTAPIAVGSGKTISWRGRRWTFETRPGEYRVLTKERDPIWVPPLWHYVEESRAKRLRIVELRWDRATPLGDGRTLTIRGDTVGILGADSTFRALPAARPIVFAGVLYVPPVGTMNRRFVGTLGKYRLNMGGGFGLHGTPDKASIGQPATHGCIRLHDADIEWLYHNVAIGSAVTVLRDSLPASPP
jgi:lipoprotein-anchoring transpeptidase ErfK/SrfK